MSGFTITQSNAISKDTLVLKLHGPLLIAHVPVFQERVRAVDAKLIVLDFTEVSYMDSAGLGAVIQLYRQQLPFGRRVVLIHLNQRVAALLKLTRADTILEVQPDLKSAEKSAV